MRLQTVGPGLVSPSASWRCGHSGDRASELCPPPPRFGEGPASLFSWERSLSLRPTAGGGGLRSRDWDVRAQEAVAAEEDGGATSGRWELPAGEGGATRTLSCMGPRAAVDAPPSVSRDQPTMLLWLLALSALGVGAWGDFWRKTPSKRVSERLPSPAGNGSPLTDVPTMVSRKEWGAGAAGCSVRLPTPVDFLITHHVPGLGCHSQAVCSQQLRALQAHHVLHNGWCDVAYNFLVGDDGRVYEGVGWNVQGTHTPGYSNASLGLAFFGSENGSSPSRAALSAAKDLVAYAVQKGYLSPSYIQPLLLKEELCLAPRQRAMPSKDCPVIVPRAAWGARETHCSKMDLPAKYVVIIHTAGASCNTSADCRLRVRDTQAYHMDRLDFCDIGYHFLVGQDGGVYEGVGWRFQGSHTFGYNDIGLGVAFMGDFGEKPPNAAALGAAQALIQCGLDEGFLAPSYLLVGHSDVSNVLSPGKALYNIISTWPHFKQRGTSQP
ncbi:peptidoglycan recognition protein 4 [Pteropus vampyrus]|uniref:Peptidoglycan recognition protein 4 n=1 Tax=Pteropus vampyrus TaxID=132908 RepID=A0A6P6BX43_PTEVA|nr:peptidoglycan recognition protein 4 [Pteropus vampyrus]